MQDVVIIIVILAILGCAIFYIYKEKKKGTKCIGCPYANACSNKNHKNQKCKN